MFPTILELGAIKIHSYGVMAAIGFLLASWLVGMNCKRANISKDTAFNLIFTALVAGIAGARIFFVVQFWRLFKNNPQNIIRIDQGGLVFYGGFILAIVAIYIHCRIKKIDFISVLDIFTPAIAAAHACGRVGCFLHGCCYGAVSSMPWAVVYPENSIPYSNCGATPLHPVQIYEAVWNICAAFLFFYLLRRKDVPRGLPMSIYFVLYGVFRFVNEFWRGDNARIASMFTIAQIIGLLLVPAGILLACYFVKNGGKDVKNG
jgi:phosphatidylglycerol:prolipoprotein diacylglycerol transferase